MYLSKQQALMHWSKNQCNKSILLELYYITT